MTSELLETAPACDVAGLARGVALAVANERKGTGRPHRLGDEAAVCALLTALQGGASVNVAARASGFSEAAVRLWLKVGATPGARPPEAALVAALAALREAQDPARLAALQAQREDEARARLEAAAVEARRVADGAARYQRIMVAVRDLAARVDRDGLTADALLIQRELDLLLQLEAPAVETSQDRERRFRRWLVLTRRPALNDRDYEMARARGFRAEGFA